MVFLVVFELIANLFLSLPQARAQAPTLSQRLGYGNEAKILILHMDDLGSSSSANLAARAGFASGLAKSGSVMMPGPAVGELPARLEGLNQFDLGIHLTLTADGRSKWTPVAPENAVTSLLDGYGGFNASPLNLVVFGRANEIEAEFEAQIQAAIRMGLNPSHVDTHMGSAFYRPSFISAYLKLAKKYQLVPMVPRWSNGLQSLLGAVSKPVSFFVNPLLSKIESAGYLLLDDFYIFPFPSKAETYESRKAKYMKTIKGLRPGVTEIILHPAYADREFQEKVLSGSPGEIVRDHEANLLSDPEFKELIESEGIKVIQLRDIQRIYPWADVQDVDL